MGDDAQARAAAAPWNKSSLLIPRPGGGCSFISGELYRSLLISGVGSQGPDCLFSGGFSVMLGSFNSELLALSKKKLDA